MLNPQRHGKGHLADPHGLIGTPHFRLGLPHEIPEEWNLAERAPPITDQLNTSMCVGKATARAISTFFRVAGAPLDDEPSEQGLYTNARAIDRSPLAGSSFDEFAPLTDDGAMPIQCMRALTEFGVPMASAWPFDASKINEEPTVAREAIASRIKLDGWYRIYPSPANPKAFVEALCQAIAGGYPVCGAIMTDQAFDDYAGGTLTTASGARLGGHFLCFNRYETTAGGARILFGDNSWGTSWGEAGRFHGDERFIARIHDVVIMRLSRIPLAA